MHLRFPLSGPVLSGMVLSVALAVAGCDDAASSGGGSDGAADVGPPMDVGPPRDVGPPDRPDRGPPPDMRPPDRPDMLPPDMLPPDMSPPDMRPPTPGAPGVVAGGARRSTARYQMTVTVGGPAPTAARQSPRFNARIGVGVPSIDTAGAP